MTTHGDAAPDRPPERDRDPVTEPARDPADVPAGARAPSRSGSRGALLRSAIRPTRRQLVLAVVLALVGYGTVVQVRVNDLGSDYDALRQQDLIDVLNGLAGTSQRAQAEISRLTATRDRLQDDQGARSAALERARDEVDTLAVLAGVVAVTGPGIRVTITEVDGTVRLSSMLDLIQELRTVGAEAIQINGEVRVIASTSFADVEGGLLVDGGLVEPPYVVDAIGDPGVLAGAIEFALGPRSQLETDGARVEVDQLASLDIESVQPGPVPQYAAPDQGQ